MNYEAKYKEMEKTVQDLYSVTTSLNNYAQRLSNVRYSLGLFTSLLGYRNSVGSRANAVITATNATRNAGLTLDSARIEYLISEQKVYQLISGDRSFNIGDGVTPVNVPSVGITRPSWWALVWDFMFPTVVVVGPGIPLPFWPAIPWWMFAFLIPSPNPGGGAQPGANIGVEYENAADRAMQQKVEKLMAQAESAWAQASVAERKAILNKLLADVQAVMGTSAKSEIKFESMGASTNGSYSHSEKTVRINKDKLSDANSIRLIKTVVHETRHAYQKEAVEGKNHPVSEETRKLWKDGFDNYTTSDYEKYYNNPVEVDARKFAGQV